MFVKRQDKGGKLDSKLSDCHAQDVFMRFCLTSGEQAFDKCATKSIAEFMSTCV